MIFNNLIAAGVSLALTGVLVSGCMSTTAGPGGPTTGVPSSPSSPATGSTELTIKINNGKGATKTWRLTCDPAGGDHPKAAAACDALDKNADKALPPVSKDMACAEVYGGPQTAEISGTWRGKSVTSSLSRVNACETARWDALKPLLAE